MEYRISADSVQFSYSVLQENRGSQEQILWCSAILYYQDLNSNLAWHALFCKIMGGPGKMKIMIILSCILLHYSIRIYYQQAMRIWSSESSAKGTNTPLNVSRVGSCTIVLNGYNYTKVMGLWTLWEPSDHVKNP